MILGLPLTGKSRLAAKLTEGADRVIFFDPMSDYAAYAGARQTTLNELAEHPEWLSEPRFRIAIVPDGEDYEGEVAETISIAYQVRNLILVFDEVGDYRSVTERMLNRVSRTGRHSGIVPIYVSQVATDIPLTVRRLATRVYSFTQFFERDLSALESVYGIGFTDRVKKLRKGEHATWTLPTLEAG